MPGNADLAGQLPLDVPALIVADDGEYLDAWAGG